MKIIYLKTILVLMLCFALFFQSNYAQFSLWGMTERGGAAVFPLNYDGGVLFQFDPITNTFTKKIDFATIQTAGIYPVGGLLLANNGKLYGMTQSEFSGGMSGSLFEYDLKTDTYLQGFSIISCFGKLALGSLIQATNDSLYGTTIAGGYYSNGNIFEYNFLNGNCNNLYDYEFNSNLGKGPGNLLQASDGIFYGMTVAGGIFNRGVIFKFDLTTKMYTKLVDFIISNGKYPHGGLIQANNGKLYGMTGGGGIYDFGVLFEYDISTSTFIKKIDFDSTNTGYWPNGTLLQANNGKLYGLTSRGGNYDAGIIFEYDINNNILKKIFDFDGVNSGKYPMGSLMQSSNNKIYGTTTEGGTTNDGVIFEFDPITNFFIKKFDFDSINGSRPGDFLIEVADTLVSISDAFQKKETIQISPNPTCEIINIQINNNHQKKFYYSLYDIIGKTIEQGYIENNSKIDISDLKEGIYILKVKTSNKTYINKLIKNN